jgi:hypothetical protein
MSINKHKMKKFEFSDLKLIEVEEIYVVTYNDKILSLDGKTTFSKYSSRTLLA